MAMTALMIQKSQTSDLDIVWGGGGGRLRGVYRLTSHDANKSR